ncbi:MAG: preprotein translocase subunit SecA, partial [Gammaproteobacteria bacterium]|nr:preprotein translocase subunit SecA [Gammaproteobacteria bacterium]
GIPHSVLNAKFHEMEAHIIAQAGRKGAVTIANNMGGRGTDIILGDNPEVFAEQLLRDRGIDPAEATEEQHAEAFAESKRVCAVEHEAAVAAGGLAVIGTERHDSRRIDNQLRGRSGRQGDPGSSRFYLSLEDNLMRIFAADWVQKVMERMGLKEDDIIESPLVSKQIANAQRKVEAHNFDIRKNLLDFDDVNNDQRKVIYGQRNELLESDDISGDIAGIRGDVVGDLVDRFVPPESIDEQWDLPGLQATLESDFGLATDLVGWASGEQELDTDRIQEHVQGLVAKLFADKEAAVGPETMRMLEKHIMLSVLDDNWKQHLARMDYLRQGIHLRGYAQKQPKQEYKKEAFELFSEMLDKVKREVVTLLARVRVRTEEEVAAMEAQERAAAEAQARRMQFQHADSGGYGADEEAATPDYQLGGDPAGQVPKVGRNEPCPCGSGRKYKHCHGQIG